MSLEVRFPLRRGEFSLDVDLALPGAGVTAISGKSGSGKTSLLRAVAGLDFHEGGFVKLGDSVWQDGGKFVPPHRRGVGYVFQEAGLFPHLTVGGNIDYGRKRAGKGGAEDWLELLGIGGLMERKPSTLSGGERQRVAMARALAARPEILLMDEPLASLDAERKAEVLPYLAALHGELSIPVLYVSHDAGEIARLADHLVLIGEGGVLAEGALGTVMTRLDLPLAQGRDAAAILETTVAGRDREFGLAQLEFDGGSMRVPDMGIPVGAGLRVQVAARDVSLALEEARASSIQNSIHAVVDSLRETGYSEVVVSLRAGGNTLLSRITRKSARDLELASGKKIVAQVKSVAVLG